MSIAKEKSLDLVEISPKAQPPVCKIMDYGQFLYQQKKIDQKSKKKQKKTEVKGIRLGVRIGDHDLEDKEKQARKFIENGNLVRVVMMFKGREITHFDLGMDKIKQFAEMLADVAKVEQEAKRQGYQIVMLLSEKK